MPVPQVLPILDENLEEFSSFLHQYMGSRLSPAEWRAAFEQDWCDDKPNNGFMLRDNSRIVGAIGAIYASRLMHGSIQKFCNITSWCVLGEYRTHGMRLATILTSQRGYHFTDFTPTKVVADVLRFLKFKTLDARQIIVPNLPWIGYPTSGVRVVDEPCQMQAELPEERARVLRDHLHLPWIRQLVFVDSSGPVHIVYKRVNFKQFSCAFVLAVSDRDRFARNFSLFRHYLLLKQRISSTRLEQRLLSREPLLKVKLKTFPRMLFYSPTLKEADIDNLYSELTSIDMRSAFL